MALAHQFGEAFGLRQRREDVLCGWLCLHDRGPGPCWCGQGCAARWSDRGRASQGWGVQGQGGKRWGRVQMGWKGTRRWGRAWTSLVAGAQDARGDEQDG